MEDLGFDNIMSDLEIGDLFGGEVEGSGEPVTQKKENDVSDAQDTVEQEPTDVNPDLLFGSSQEKVGVDDDKNDKRGENDSREKANSSPSFYSSILSAFRDDGLLPELTDEEIENVKDDTDVKELFNKVLDSRLDQRTKRIQDALNGGADIQEVKQYENILAQLTNISEDAVSEEGEAGEDLRRRIIAQDYMNRGFSRERIERELRKSFNAGTDIDDAKEALQNNIQFFTEKYQGIIRQGQERDKQFRDNTRKQGEELRKSIVESDEGIFGEIGVDKKTRQKIYDNISKPAYKDENGNWYTEIQKYEMDHRTDFLKYVSLFYTMTDGFKNIDKIVKKEVQKKVKSRIADLENVLQGTSRNSSGTLKMVGQDDPESSYLGENLFLDSNF